MKNLCLVAVLCFSMFASMFTAVGSDPGTSDSLRMSAARAPKFVAAKMFNPAVQDNSRPDSFYLNFPLPNRTAYTALINSVFDHYAPDGAYHSDGRIIAYTGESGEHKQGNNQLLANTIGGESLYAYQNSTVSYPFIMNGNYAGVGTPQYMYYDSHDGIDFKTTDQQMPGMPAGMIPVLAAADGDLKCIAGSANNTVEIDHRNGYVTRYLHMSSRNCTTPVRRGEKIGIADGIGAGGSIHLHFSVLHNGRLVDPYGWQGQYPDPNGTDSTNLWKPKAATGTVFTSNYVRWHPNGTLITDYTQPQGTVWLIEGGHRRGIPSVDVFRAYGFDFANVIKVSPDEISCLPEGGILQMPPPNTATSPRLVNDNGVIYEITDKGRRRGFASARIFSGQGFRWEDVKLGSAASYHDDPNIPVYNSPFREGTLIAQLDTSNQQRRIMPNTPIYIISDSKKRKFNFSSGDLFLKLGYRFEDVVTLPSLDGIPDGQPINDLDVYQCGTDFGGASDELAPELIINSPANGETFYNGVVAISGTASDAGRGESGISSVTVNVSRASNDSANVSDKAYWSSSLTLSPGANNITVIAKDNSPAQNASTRTLTLYYQLASPPTNPTFTSAASANPNPAAVGQNVALQSSFTSPSGAGDVIVDTEIYDAANQRVFQSFSEHQNFSSGQTLNYVWNWTPSTAGQYKVKTAVFNNNWSSNYYWNEAALNVTVGNATSPPTNPTFSTATSVAPNPAIVSQPVNISVTVRNLGEAASDVIIDVEVYDVTGNKLFQNFFEHQNFAANGAQTYTQSWTPSAAGQYTVKIGIFRNDWGANYSWNGNAATIGVNTSSPPSASSIDIWWPSDGTQVSGTQPFKAVVSNLGLSQYTMSWQVDGGGLVPMADSYQDAPHKEVSVDLSGWTWRGIGPYSVNFMAKDGNGNIIAQRTISIYVTH